MCMYSAKLVDQENMALFSQNNKDEFTLLRRKGFGASDSSILLGLNKWTTLDQLIVQKNSKEITDEERAIGEKPQVRMGADLEPLILQKFEDWANLVRGSVEKPDCQYRLQDYPFLTVNYDGMWGDIPVEAKCISQFATKYWDFEKAIKSPSDCAVQKYGSANSTIEKIKTQAKMVGIPDYYYTQVQQQLLGTTADHAYLAAISVKDWNLYVFHILEDEDVQSAIITAGQTIAEYCPEIPK